MPNVGLLILRLGAGVVFIADGVPKLVPVWDQSPREAAELLGAAGIASAYPVSIGTGITEVLAGLLLLMGAYVTWAAMSLAATTATRSWALTVSNGVFPNLALEPGGGGGYAVDFLRLAALVCLMLTGPGAIAYDTRRARERAWGKAAVEESQTSS